MKKHTTLNECIYDAIDLDDNCDIFGKDKPITGSVAPSTRGSVDTEKTRPAEAEVIAEMVMKKMNQMFKPPQKMHRCDICGGDHPTSQCTKQEQPAQRAPRTNKWCNFCQLWTNHETQECYYRIRFMREQAGNQQPAAAPQQPQYGQRGGNQNYVAQGGERAQPVLGNQPPLPGAAPVRLLRADEYAPDGTMVPVEYYVENTESSLALAPTTQGYTEEPLPTVEGHYQMDHNTLWFIANGGARQVGPAPRPL